MMSSLIAPPTMPSPQDASALVAHDETRSFVAKGAYNNNKQKKNRPYCEHCKRPGHTRDTCWVIHDKPADWKPSRYSKEHEPQANAATTNPFSPEQLEMLQCIIKKANQLGDPSKAGSSRLVAQRGIQLRALQAIKAYHVNTDFSSVWIMDSGASDHMSYMSLLLMEHEPWWFVLELLPFHKSSS